MKKLWELLLIVILVVTSGFLYAESPNFLQSKLTASGASLTSNTYSVSRVIGSANFADDFTLPLQLVYDSAPVDARMVGFAWSIPQFDSMVVLDGEGLLWTTPWGEKVRFYPKELPANDTLKLFAESMQNAKAFHTPYSDFEADKDGTSSKVKTSSNWTIRGQKRYSGWAFYYQNSQLSYIETPRGTRVNFAYDSQSQLSSVESSGTKFIELEYHDNAIKSLVLNGTKHDFSYSRRNLTIMPNTQAGVITRVPGAFLASIKTEGLSRVNFDYDSYGYLSKIEQDNLVRTFTAELASLAERKEELRLASIYRPYIGPVAGRLSKTDQYTYSYPSSKIGKVTLTNLIGETASFDYSPTLGFFKTRDFAGREQTVYYSLRLDVAYLGKVNQIINDKGQILVSYNYNYLTGELIRVTNTPGNVYDFGYKDSKLVHIERRATNSGVAEPLLSLSYPANSREADKISTLDASGAPVRSTEIVYDGTGRPTKVFDGQKTRQFLYNSRGLISQVSDDFGIQGSFEFDMFNRLIALTDSFGVRTSYTYTPWGALSQVERSVNGQIRTKLTVGYDGRGLPESYTDQSGRTKRFERNEFGRVVKELFPDDTSVKYGYDVLGRLTKVTDQNNHDLKFDYGKYGLEKRITTVGQLTEYLYNASGVLSAQNSVSAKGRTDRAISYKYDEFNRVTGVFYGGSEYELYQLDAWGRVAKISRSDKSLTLTRDYYGNVVESTEGSLVNRYTFDRYGNRLERVTQDGALVLSEKNTFDKFGRLVETSSSNQTVKYI